MSLPIDPVEYMNARLEGSIPTGTRVKCLFGEYGKCEATGRVTDRAVLSGHNSVQITFDQFFPDDWFHISWVQEIPE